MSSSLLLVAVLVVVFVAVVAVIVVRIRAARSRPQFAAAEVVVDPDKKAVLNLKSQAGWLPAIPLFVDLVKRTRVPIQLEQADVGREVTVEDVARMKLLMLLLFGVLGLILGFLLGSPLLMVVLGVGGAAVGFRSPDGTIRTAANVRQAKLSRALPLALEVIGLAVERTSIDSGIEYYCRFFSQEVLAQELGYTIQRVQQLKERLDVAMGELLHKNRNDDLSFLVAAVGQASQVGGRDLKDMLRGQAQELRVKRGQEVKARSLRAPVMITFPTMLNMLALLVVLGSLAFLQIGNSR